MEAQPTYSLEELVSDKNVQRWGAVYGEQANAWLSELPDIVAGYAQQWNLDIDEPLEGGSVSVVVGATQHSENPSTERVLKIYPPWVPTVDGCCRGHIRIYLTYRNCHE